MPETINDWDQAEASAIKHPLRCAPLPHEAIKVTDRPHPVHSRLTEFRAEVNLVEVMGVDNGYLHLPGRDKTAEDRLRNELRRKIYGRLRQDARDLAMAIKRSHFMDFEEWQKIQALLEPLITAGHELTDSPTNNPKS